MTQHKVDYLLVGLGNPGSKYFKTRHNAGFMVLDELAARQSLRFRRKWFGHARYSFWLYKGKRICLLKPFTYMNSSGQAVAPLMRELSLDVDHLIVVVDDLSLPVGQLRLRKKGRAGGHNGLKSIIADVGSEAFIRLRMGIGAPPSGSDTIDYVLAAFAEEEQGLIKQSIGRAVDALEYLIGSDIEKTMNRFNG
ncbi:MAG: aminoacyl-tRNA hydrolase [Spartobacteria bacterium]|nr:aminoacyl-tRNA hydrolase [Spartobacteria bacterium]